MGHTQSRHENFFSTQPRDVHICSQEEGAEILARAEHSDKYRSACEASRLNRLARQGQDYSARAPTADAAPFLRAIESFPKWLKNYLPPVLYIIFIANSADGGMPHTRQPNIICLPQYFDIEGEAGRKTFMHECIHIHQRTYPELWDRIYYEVFHMQPYKGDFPDKLAQRRRLNPDTLLQPHYMWRERWVAVPIFLSDQTPALGNIRIAYYNVKSGAWQSFIPPEMEMALPSLSIAQAEHPNELAAYWLTDGHSNTTLLKELEELIENLSNDEYM